MYHVSAQGVDERIINDIIIIIIIVKIGLVSRPDILRS